MVFIVKLVIGFGIKVVKIIVCFCKGSIVKERLSQVKGVGLLGRDDEVVVFFYDRLFEGYLGGYEFDVVFYGIFLVIVFFYLNIDY